MQVKRHFQWQAIEYYKAFRDGNWIWNLERPQESFFQSSPELLSIDKAVIGQRCLCVTAQSDTMERNQFQNQF